MSRSNDKNWLAVAAIDIGTTFSGYAFSFRSDFETNPLKITTNNWSDDGAHAPEMKAPSVLLLKEDQSFDCFGYKAQTRYTALLEDSEDVARQYYYLENFKMQLYERDITLDMVISDVTGKKILAMKVFTESIKFLKDHCLKRFNDRGLQFTIKDIFFVITVPAIWSDAAKQFMRNASEGAGINRSQMILAYEPEAAALYCSVLPADQGLSKNFDVGRKLMIVDLGGGTADITVVKVIKKENKLTYLEHVYKVTIGPWGGHQVNVNFESFLDNVFGRIVMRQFKEQYLIDYMEIMKDFEIKKKSVLTDQSKLIIKIPGELKEMYQRVNKIDLQQNLRQSFPRQVELVRDKLKINPIVFEGFFIECVKKITTHIHDTFSKEDCSFLSAIVLVGGFSEAPLIKQAIATAFPAIKDIIRPFASSLSVLKGSVVFGHEPTVITGRVCPETLGVALHRPYIPDVHLKEKTFKLGGKLRVDDCFEKIFTINEVIHIGEKRTKEVHDLHTDPELQVRRRQPKTVEVYASLSENCQYITDVGCRLKGRITVYPPGDKWPEVVEGFIELKAGGTEITVRYRDKHSGQVTEGNIDFM